MVRHSDLDRRRSDQHTGSDSRAGMEILSLLDGRLLSSFLADQSRSHSHGNRIHPNSARDQRTGTSGGRIAASSMGLSRRRRLRSHVSCAITIHELQRFPEVSDSRAEWNSGLLGDSFSEHSRLYALRPQTNENKSSARHWRCRRP